MAPKKVSSVSVGGGKKDAIKAVATATETGEAFILWKIILFEILNGSREFIFSCRFAKERRHCVHLRSELEDIA